MQLTIRFDLDNAAFAGDDAGGEVSRILRALALSFADTGSIRPFHSLNIRDVNGNIIGTYKVTG